LAGLAVVFGLALLLRWPIAAIPLERDEGEYAYIGQRWLLGEIPYQSSFDQKPPGVFVAYAVILRLVGTSPAAIHWAAQVYALGTLALIFLLGRKLFSPLTGLLAALLATVLAADPGVFGQAANTELFMLLPMTGAFLTALLAVERRSFGWALLTGLLSAAAVLFKQVAVLDGLFYLLLLLAGRGARGRLVAGMLVGAGLLIVPCVSYFWLAGAVGDFYDCTIGYNLQYAGARPLSRYLPSLLSEFPILLASAWPIYLLAAAGLVLALTGPWRKPEIPTSRAGILVAGWLCASFLGIVPGGSFFLHYFVQIVPPLALLAARGAIGLFQGLAAPAWVRNGLAVAAAATAMMGSVASASWYYLQGTPAQKCRQLYGMNPFPEAPEVAAFVAANSHSDESVLIYGSEPQIYFYAARKSATRYIFVYPLMTGFADAARRQQTAVAEINRRQPAVIVAVNAPTSFARDRARPRDLDEALDDLLKRRYVKTAVVLPSRDAPSPLITGNELNGLPPPYLIMVWQRRRASGTPEPCGPLRSSP
jgi:Dolichyl-phosphate-mannose-protein mannosyltransferase